MAYIGLHQALSQEAPLQIVGTINAYTALLAKNAGYKAIYLSGAGVANASYGWPDLGITNLTDVLTDVKRITYACDLPLLVDIDTGWGTAFNIARSIKSLEDAGAKAIHIEDQVQAKRCGHRPGKTIVSTDEMCDRIKAAVDARIHREFVIMARTDALASEGMEATLARLHRYVESGADMIFFEGATDLKQYQHVTQTLSVPILANMTEFGVTPNFSKNELQQVGIQLILYPLSAFRAMNKTAETVYKHIRQHGSQKEILPMMQTREELYKTLDYHHYEEILDALLAKGNLK
jgi:methylisocitrate lyase